jgi:hypothetical protein
MSRETRGNFSFFNIKFANGDCDWDAQREAWMAKTKVKRGP